MPFASVPKTSVPRTVPTIVPRPPVSEVPPMTTAVTDVQLAQVALVAGRDAVGARGGDHAGERGEHAERSCRRRAWRLRRRCPRGARPRGCRRSRRRSGRSACGAVTNTPASATAPATSTGTGMPSLVEHGEHEAGEQRSRRRCARSTAAVVGGSRPSCLRRVARAASMRDADREHAPTQSAHVDAWRDAAAEDAGSRRPSATGRCASESTSATPR